MTAYSKRLNKKKKENFLFLVSLLNSNLHSSRTAYRSIVAVAGCSNLFPPKISLISSLAPSPW